VSKREKRYCTYLDGQEREGSERRYVGVRLECGGEKEELQLKGCGHEIRPMTHEGEKRGAKEGIGKRTRVSLSGLAIKKTLRQSNWIKRGRRKKIRRETQQPKKNRSMM